MTQHAEVQGWLTHSAWELIANIGIDGHALFGAMLGAWLVSSSRRKLDAWMLVSRKRRLKAWQRAGSLLLSAGVGYLFTPLILSLAPSLSSGVGAFIAAVVVIPISIKVMVWLDTADLKEIVQRWRGR